MIVLHDVLDAYRRSTRSCSEEVVLPDAASYAASAAYLRTVCGDQGLSPHLAVPPGGPQFVTISDTYPTRVSAWLVGWLVGQLVACLVGCLV